MAAPPTPQQPPTQPQSRAAPTASRHRPSGPGAQACLHTQCGNYVPDRLDQPRCATLQTQLALAVAVWLSKQLVRSWHYGVLLTVPSTEACEGPEWAALTDSGSAAGKPAHVLYDMDADLALALQLSAAEAEAAERRATGVCGGSPFVGLRRYRESSQQCCDAPTTRFSQPCIYVSSAATRRRHRSPKFCCGPPCTMSCVGQPIAIRQ